MTQNKRCQKFDGTYKRNVLCVVTILFVWHLRRKTEQRAQSSKSRPMLVSYWKEIIKRRDLEMKGIEMERVNKVSWK